MKSKLYYAGASDHGSNTGYGFANDWTVLVFADKKSRDNWVENCGNLSAVPIKRRDVTKRAANWSLTQNKLMEPNTFKREFWGINNLGENVDKGIVGYIHVFSDDYRNNILVKRFYS